MPKAPLMKSTIYMYRYEVARLRNLVADVAEGEGREKIVAKIKRLEKKLEENPITSALDAKGAPGRKKRGKDGREVRDPNLAEDGFPKFIGNLPEEEQKRIVALRMKKYEVEVVAATATTPSSSPQEQLVTEETQEDAQKAAIQRLKAETDEDPPEWKPRSEQSS